MQQSKLETGCFQHKEHNQSIETNPHAQRKEGGQWLFSEESGTGSAVDSSNIMMKLIDSEVPFQQSTVCFNKPIFIIYLLYITK